jgi:hypothetical protein
MRNDRFKNFNRHRDIPSPPCRPRVCHFQKWAIRNTVLEGISNIQTIRAKLRRVMDKSPSKSAIASLSPSSENDIADRSSECPRISATSFAVPLSENNAETSKMRIKLSVAARASVVPSGLRAASMILREGPRPIVRKSQAGAWSFGERLLSSTERIRAVLPSRRRKSSVAPSFDNSKLASDENARALAKSTFDSRALTPDDVTIRIPSGLKDALCTAELRSASLTMACPDAASHMRAVLSHDAVTIRVPSGLKAAELTLASCPRRAAISCPDAASIILAESLQAPIDALLAEEATLAARRAGLTEAARRLGDIARATRDEVTARTLYRWQHTLLTRINPIDWDAMRARTLAAARAAEALQFRGAVDAFMKALAGDCQAKLQLNGATMTMLVDDLLRHPAVLDRAISAEIKRRVASVGARSKEARAKLDRIDAMFAEKEAAMAQAGYRIDLVRLRREDGLA